MKIVLFLLTVKPGHDLDHCSRWFREAGSQAELLEIMDVGYAEYVNGRKSVSSVLIANYIKRLLRQMNLIPMSMQQLLLDLSESNSKTN